MRPCRLLCVTLVSGFVLSAQTSYYLPEIADGVVPAGTVKTTVVVANTAKTAATITMTPLRDDGSPRTLTVGGLGTNTRFSTKLNPGATRVIVTDGSGDGSTGAMVLSADAAISVSEVLSYADLAGNPLGASGLPGLSDQDLALEYKIPVDTTGGVNAGVALYNPGKTAVTVTLKLFDPSGAAAGSATLSLGPQRHVTRLAKDDLFAGLGDFRGTLDVTGTAVIAASAIRQNAASATYTLLPATSALSRRLRFVVPQIADGPTDTGLVQSTLILTNLSAKPASVTLSLTQDDGSALAVNIPGFDPTTPATIAPGATVFWQTDGTSAALASGAAAIRSSQPLAVSAVVTALAADGSFVSETGLAPAATDFQFVVPFDSASNPAPGVLFVNTGRKPVAPIVNLSDPDGKLAASTVLSPIAPGGRFAGKIADLFPDAALPSGFLSATTGNPLTGSFTALSLLPGAAGSAPAMALPRVSSGTPATVVPKLDTAHVATASIPPGGGTLTVTDAKGNRFTLTLPPGALLNRETITMTAISSATGVSGPGLIAGVQLEPDGLGLLQPATLKIELASPAPANIMPIGWRNQTPGVYLNPPLPDPNSLTLVLTHFSGAGAGGFDLSSELITIANNLDYYQSLVSAAIGNARQAALAGDEQASADANATILDLINQDYVNVIEPLMELAQASDDEDVMRCAATYALGFARQLELSGEGDGDMSAAIEDFASYIMQRAMQKLLDRCSAKDFTVFYDIMAQARQMAMFGIDIGAAIDKAQSCPPKLDLMYKSNINGIIPVGLTGTFDATVSAKISVTGSFTKDMLTQVVDPAKDLLTSFTLTGSGVETYDSMNLTVNNLTGGCTVSISRKTPDTLTVKAGQDPKLSQVQFKFNPHYDPQALTRNNQQLCSFCPVYRKTPIKVELWIDPGKPQETILSTCPGGSMSLGVDFWWTGWATNHANAGDNGFIQSWNMKTDPTFSADKTINESVTGPSATLREKTDLMLMPPK